MSDALFVLCFRSCMWGSSQQIVEATSSDDGVATLTTPRAVQACDMQSWKSLSSGIYRMTRMTFDSVEYKRPQQFCLQLCFEMLRFRAAELQGPQTD